VLTIGKHFLSTLRGALYRAEESQHQTTKITQEEAADLTLWLHFLELVRKGISLNLLVCREPNTLLRTDGAPYGIGGYSLKTGIAWRIQIPIEFQGRLSQNFIEYLGCAVGIKVAIMTGEIEPEDCVMSLTDNTSAMGWLRKSNFAPNSEQDLHFRLSRDLAQMTLKHGFCLYSQWFAGVENVVADALSRWFHLSDDELSLKLRLLYPEQVPASFKILQLPPEFISAVSYWEQAPRPTPASNKAPTTPKTATGNAGPHSWAGSTSPTTPSSESSVLPSASASWEPSPMPFAPANSAEAASEMTRLLRQVAAPPSAVWQRPSPQRDFQTPGRDPMEKWYNFYADK
jgi:hypothetical protein